MTRPHHNANSTQASGLGAWGVARLRSFRYAGAGLRVLLATQPNARIHALATVCVVGMGLFLGIGPRDWAALVLAVALVWTAEALNTALEALADAAVPEQHPLIQRAKDVGAAAVLLAAIASVVVGLLVMGPPLAARIADSLGLAG